MLVKFAQARVLLVDWQVHWGQWRPKNRLVKRLVPNHRLLQEHQLLLDLLK